MNTVKPSLVCPQTQEEGCHQVSQEGKHQGIPGRRGMAGAEGVLSHHWAHRAVLISISTHPQHLSLFSHSATSRPPGHSSWLSSMLTWAPLFLVASSGPEMTGACSISHIHQALRMWPESTSLPMARALKPPVHMDQNPGSKPNPQSQGGQCWGGVGSQQSKSHHRPAGSHCSLLPALASTVSGMFPVLWSESGTGAFSNAGTDACGCGV